MSKKKDDLKNLFNKVQKVTTPPVQKVNNEGKVSPVKKQGRPSKKIEGVEYIKLCARVPAELRDEIKMAMLTTHKHLKHTQDTFIETAVREYLNSQNS